MSRLSLKPHIRDLLLSNEARKGQPGGRTQGRDEASRLLVGQGRTIGVGWPVVAAASASAASGHSGRARVIHVKSTRRRPDAQLPSSPPPLFSWASISFLVAVRRIASFRRIVASSCCSAEKRYAADSSAEIAIVAIPALSSRHLLVCAPQCRNSCARKVSPAISPGKPRISLLFFS